MNRKWPNVLFPLLAVLILTGACARAEPDLKLETSSFQFGPVENGKIVQRTILVYNEGNAPLIIRDISTSCGCTTGIVDPGIIQPGESGELKISFDSGAHGPDLEGMVKRQVFIHSSDPGQEEAVVEFTAEVIRPGSNY